MAITIKGIRLNTVAINFDKDEEAVTSEYSLLSSTDKVLAKQAVSQYGMKVPLSADTRKSLDAFVASYRRDIQNAIGLETEA
jgi:hypothetical protein